MHCDEFERRMQGLLDDRTPPEWDGDLQAHALVCGSCRRRLRLQEDLFEGLRQFEPPPSRRAIRVGPSLDGPERFQRVEKVSWRGYLAAAVAAAACLLLFFTIRAGGPLPNQPESQHATATGHASIASAAPDPGAVDRYRMVLSFAGTQLDALDALDSQRLRSSLRPLASSFHVALDALRRTLPIRSYWPDQETTRSEQLPPITATWA